MRPSSSASTSLEVSMSPLPVQSMTSTTWGGGGGQESRRAARGALQSGSPEG
jgi:hypothetical protein